MEQPFEPQPHDGYERDDQHDAQRQTDEERGAVAHEAEHPGSDDGRRDRADERTELPFRRRWIVDDGLAIGWDRRGTNVAGQSLGSPPRGVGHGPADELAGRWPRWSHVK